MKVKLLKDVMEADRFGNLALKTSVRKNRPSFAFTKGTIVEMSDASCAKYIANGLAELYAEPTEGAA